MESLENLDNVIEKITRNGKTYFNITDYEKLHELFGQLLREVQRIKSEGDFNAGKALVENYGVKVDQKLHVEVLERNKQFASAAYNGFVNPILVPKLDKKGRSPHEAIKGKRKAYSPIARDFIPYTVYDRYKLYPNATFKGPAIIEEKESTLIVGEDTSVSVDGFGFLWVDIKEGKVEGAPRKKGLEVRAKRSRLK